MTYRIGNPLGRAARIAVLLALLLLPSVPAALADETGFQLPTATAIGTTGNGCSNPTQALLADVATGTTADALTALCRTANPPTGVADTQLYRDFGFSLPPTAIIDGVTAEVRGYRTGPTTGPNALTNLQFQARLSGDGGTTWTSGSGVKSTPALTATDAAYLLGGASDLWNAAWTASSFTNANFRLEVRPTGPTATGEHWKLDSVRVKVHYHLPEVPPLGFTGQGCGAGYWKHHLAAWSATGISPSSPLNSLFTIDSSTLGTTTAQAALSFGGGDSLEEAAQILLRQAVAATLNARHPGLTYPRSAAAVQTDVNAALASTNRTTILNLANALDTDNNLGCPLN
jgi:hypothetical protein